MNNNKKKEIYCTVGFLPAYRLQCDIEPPQGAGENPTANKIKSGRESKNPLVVVHRTPIRAFVFSAAGLSYSL
jgi:hypothetical protein